jgi:hypothetical protein
MDAGQGQNEGCCHWGEGGNGPHRRLRTAIKGMPMINGRMGD